MMCRILFRVEQYGNIEVLCLFGGVMAKFVYIEHEGKRATLAYWARHFGIAYSVFKMRYARHGWDLDKLRAVVQRRSRARK